MQVVVNGGIIVYETHGDKKKHVALLLHGWGDSKDTFSSLQKTLESSYYVISLDLPGFGGSAKPKDTYDLQKYADTVAAFLNKIDVDPQKIDLLLGHSNGGAIAIKSLSSGALKADKLVLLASSGVRATYKARKKALRLLAKAAKIPTSLLPESAQKRIKRRVYSAIGSELFVAEDLQDTFKNVVSEDLVDESARIKAKTLLIYGEYDTATPPSYGRRFASHIGGSKLIIVPGAKHFVHHTHASQVQKEIVEFIS